MSDVIITAWRPNKQIINKQDNVIILYAAKDRNKGFIDIKLAYSWFTGQYDGLIMEPAFNNDYQIRYNKEL